MTTIRNLPQNYQEDSYYEDDDVAVSIYRFGNTDWITYHAENKKDKSTVLLMDLYSDRNEIHVDKIDYKFFTFKLNNVTLDRNSAKELIQQGINNGELSFKDKTFIIK